jgi:Flp pilus assembly protein TadD
MLAGCSHISSGANSKDSESSLVNNTQKQVIQISVKNVLYDEYFDEVDLSSVELFSLSPEQIKQFEDYYYDPQRASTREHSRFADYLSGSLSGFTYDGITYTAQEAYEKSTGNCLSLAILTTALAKVAGLDIEYQKNDSQPIFNKQGNVLLLSSHVRTKVFEPSKQVKSGRILIRRAHSIIDYFPNSTVVQSYEVKENTFIAMYHQNKAASALVDNAYDLSYAHVKKGLEHDPSHSELLNILAVIYKRIGHTSHALSVFELLEDNKLATINSSENYANLLLSMGEKSKAENILASLEDVNESNPYAWLALAKTKINETHYQRAISFVERAENLAPYLHEPHFLKASIYFQQGKLNSSRLALQKALSLAGTQDSQRLYAAKLDALKAL